MIEGGRVRVGVGGESCVKVCNVFSCITSRRKRCYFCSSLSEVVYFQ